MEDELVDVSDTEPAGSVSSWADAEEFDIAMNCHGVILVRMLSATKYVKSKEISCVWQLLVPGLTYSW